MNGHMAEAQKGFAVLEDVDEETFVRFVQWAYSGYYSPPDFDTINDESSSEAPDEEGDAVIRRRPEVFEVEPVDESIAVADAIEAESVNESIAVVEVIEESLDEPIPVAEDPYDHGWSFGGGGRRKVSKQKKNISFFDPKPPPGQSAKDALKESFIERKTTVRRESIAIPPPRPNQDPVEDYTNIFLSHARLYVFADKYDIRSLKLLALEALQNTLAIFTLYSERTGDIIELLRYIYGNTGESVFDVEDLRTLITHYIGFEMDTLMGDESFKELMVDDGGPLLGDFMRMVLKRI